MKHLKRNSTLYLPVVKAFANVSAKPPVPYKMDKTLSEIPLRVKSKHTSKLCLMQPLKIFVTWYIRTLPLEQWQAFWHWESAWPCLVTAEGLRPPPKARTGWAPRNLYKRSLHLFTWLFLKWLRCFRSCYLTWCQDIVFPLSYILLKLWSEIRCGDDMTMAIFIYHRAFVRKEKVRTERIEMILSPRLQCFSGVVSSRPSPKTLRENIISLIYVLVIYRNFF